MRTILKALAVLLVLLVGLPASAQKKWELGGGLMVGLPTGDFSDSHKMGFGISGAFCYATSPEVSVTGRLGYMTFSGKTISGVAPLFGTITFEVPSLKIIPIIVGGRYYSKAGKTQFFGSGEAGLYMLSNGDTETKFGIAPGAGVRFNMDEKYHIDVQGRYELIFTKDVTTSFIGVGGSVYFDLK